MSTSSKIAVAKSMELRISRGGDTAGFQNDIAKPGLAICARSNLGGLACSRNGTDWLVDNQPLGSKLTDYDVYPIPPLH
jgi:hypothetical protein